MDWKAFWNDNPQVRQEDFCRQVGRTFRGVGYSEEQLGLVVANLRSLLEPAHGQSLLDLACGNGLITSRLAPFFARITAADFSAPLIEAAREHFARPNVEYLVEDATELRSVNGRYDRILVSAALQHFSPLQAERMLRRLAGLLAPGGRVVLSDVPDRERIWNFYRGVRGRMRYALHTLLHKPVIGQWWSPAALRKLGKDAGFSATIRYQEPTLLNHYFRYDVVLELATLPFSPR